MWYPSPHQQQQHHHSWYGYAPQFPSQQQSYSKLSYYDNGKHLSTTSVVAINDENDSPVHCQVTHGGNAYAPTLDNYVTTSYGGEMTLYQSTTARKTYWNPVIAAPTKMFPSTRNMPTITPSSPEISPSSSASSSSSCWDWLLFSPQYYSEFYTPSSSTFAYHQQQKVEEKDDVNDDDIKLNLLASLPTCLLALLCLTPKSIPSTDDENDSDQEIGSLHRTDEPTLSSLSINSISSKLFSSSSKSSSPSNNELNKSNQNRSSTPDTDDGYQSASDASRSDYSQPSSLPYEHQTSRDDIIINEHSLPTPLMPVRITYAAAVKPITTSTNQISSLPLPVSKPKQTINKTSSSSTTSPNDLCHTNGQKLKFTAPRFERMHRAKQNSSPSTSSNRTQTRSTNDNARNHVVSSTRRR